MFVVGVAAANCPEIARSDPASTPSHGVAMHGAPALGPDFTHLPYADPDAPQGGRLVIGRRGAFDSLNPFALAGAAPWDLRSFVYESLMERSYDEPFSLYGLIAERVEIPPDRSEVVFHLRPEARFSDGAPVTVDDVIFSMETLRDYGRPNFGAMYRQIARVERVGPRGVRFVFGVENRELPLLMGLMPILSKAHWTGKRFDAGGAEPPIASGPYVVDEVEPGRRILLRKNPNHWARDLPLLRGRHNFDEIELAYFRDGSAMWEAFTAGELSLYREGDPARWAEAYDPVPAVRDGRIQRGEIAHGRPSGMSGFVFNTRRPVFQDRRARAALNLAFDYAWINQSFYRGGYKRITSYFSGSELGFDGPAVGAEAALLAPFAEALPSGAMEAGWRPPEGAGDGRNRRNIRAARKLLTEAGWTVTDGVLRDAEGAPFAFEIMLRAGDGNERIADAFVAQLKPLGVSVEIRLVDSAQYQERLNAFDFDMIVRSYGASLSPGAEQRFRWGAAQREAAGSWNFMGVADPAVDAMIDALVAAEGREAFTAAVRALDRVLSSGVYVIPFGYLADDRVAWRAEFGKPERDPLYGLRLDVWWRRGAE